MKLRILPVWSILMLVAGVAAAQEYRLEKLQEAPPAEAVSPEIAQALDPVGLRVLKGQRTVVDLWLAKQWPAKTGFTPTAQVMYPLEVGAFVGVARYKNRGGDFRQQEIPAGVYTIRYGQQPEDGNHIGTSDTRDFFLLIPAAADLRPGEAGGAADVPAHGAKAAGTTHPTMLSLLRAGEGEAPAVDVDGDRGLVSVRVKGQAKAADKTTPLALSVVIVGHAPE